MKKIKYDKNGIPILSRTDLEEKSEAFINFFNPTCLSGAPQATPLPSICERLQKDFDLKFHFNVDLGQTKEGYKYRGRFHIPSNSIFIDNSLEWNDPRFNFTLAHEIAHFVLHRKIDIKILTTEKDKEISDTNRQLILDQLNSDNPRDWIEWQANKFASSLLLPRLTVPGAVISKQKQEGVNRRLGTIFLDRQSDNIVYYKSIVDYLSKLYETSKASVKVRLKELNILIESETGTQPRSREMEHISSSFSNIFEIIEKKYKNLG